VITDVSVPPSRVGVAGDELADALPVLKVQAGDLQLAADDGGIQGGFGVRAELPVDQVGGLGDDHAGGDQRPVVAFQQRPARVVVLVGAVSGGHQRAGVDDQLQESRPKPSASMSSASAACRPDVEEPMPAKTSRRRAPGSGSRSASRSTSKGWLLADTRNAPFIAAP
jgi:hypothetical protein